MATLTVPTTRAKEARPRTKIGVIVAAAFLILWTIVSIAPFWFSAVYAFMPKAEIYNFDPPRLFPVPFTLENFQAIFQSLDLFPKWLFNSIVISLVLTIIRVMFSCAAGYSFARIKFPGRDILFTLMIAWMALPGIITLIPTYLILNEFGKAIGFKFIGNAMGIIFPSITTAFAVFMARQFFMNFPAEVEESGTMDGLSRMGLFFRIALPMSVPLLLGLGVLTFQGVWNDFQWPNIVLNSAETFTLPLGLNYLRGQYSTIFSYVLAGSLFNSVPIIIIFLIFQRFFVGGIQLSGLKEG